MSPGTHHLAALALALALPLSALAAAPSHDGQGSAVQKLGLNNGKQWLTDDLVRQGMSDMRNAIAAALPAAHANALRPTDYEALARELGARTAHVFENGRLLTNSDAQLHIVLADIRRGIDAVEGKVPGKERAQGILQIAKTLNVYGSHFVHPGWKTITLPD